MLAVRTVADLPAYDSQVPEPLAPEPPGMRIPPSRAVRRAAARQWSAWWRIAWAQSIAVHREAPVRPEPPLLGLDPFYEADPPKFASLAPVPELRQIVATTWPALSGWVEDVQHLDPWAKDGWPQDLIARADRQAGRPIADVDVQLEILPIPGLRQWTLTEAPDRHLIHALVTPEMAQEPPRLVPWLLDVLHRIG